jgi:hypothetical protein
LSTFSSNINTQTLLSPSTTTTLNDSFADFFKSLPSPLSNEDNKTNLNDTPLFNPPQQQQPAITTTSFLNNYQLPSQQNGGGGKIKGNKSKQKANKSNSGPKKHSQLIFHEYRGPNQKSSISKTNITSTTTTNSNSPFNGSPFNFNDVDNGIKANELSTYKIRLEQQKVYLLYDENVASQKIEQQQQQCVSPVPPQIPQPLTIVPTTTTSTTTETTTVNTNNQQSIQILPIQIPDNLKSILNSQQILSIISTPNGNNNKTTVNNCIAIQPPPLQSTQQQQQHKAQYTNILPSQKVNNDQQNKNKNLTLLLPTNTTNSGNATVQQLISSSSKSLVNQNKTTNIEEMTMSELKAECRRRKLHVTGNKQKLVERIKTSLNSSSSTTIQQQQQQQTTLQVVKSPDSGVGNMEYSPTFTSCK